MKLNEIGLTADKIKLWYDQLDCVRSKNVYVVDGNAYFSRPGARLVDSLEILARILNPEKDPEVCDSYYIRV